MRAERKYLVAVALLAVLAVVFGLAGSAMPASDVVSPQRSSSSSDGVAHFINPPSWDSGWLNITDKHGQNLTLTHNMDTTDALVDCVGKQSLTSGDHKLFFGTTNCIKGWNRTYGGASHDTANCMVQTSDGGYAIAGSTSSYGAGQIDFWLIKTDIDGIPLWNRTYGGADAESLHSMVQTSDNGYVLTGYTASYGAGSWDFWLVKTDSDGTMEWNRTYGGANTDNAWSVVQTLDGGYAMAGDTESFGSGNYDFWLIKTDSDGNVQWNRTYGGVENDQALSLVQTFPDGGYALAGGTSSYGAGLADLWLVKTDSDGTMEWNRTYGGPRSDWGASLTQTSDTGYAIAGQTESFGAGWGWSDFSLVKTDSRGNVQWNKTYGGWSDEAAHDVVRTHDGGYAIAGDIWTDSTMIDFWLVKTDADGTMEWNKTYGGPNYEQAMSVVHTSENGYVLAGRTYSSETGNDFWLVNVDVEFGFPMGLSMTGFSNNTITLYRGSADPYWNFVRVRIWIIEEPTWQFGDINQDGVVDAQDLLILSQNYGKTFSLLSLTGIIAIAGIHTYKTRKQPK